ncbi:TPA: hypothetical protein ACHJX8_004443 [Yersinia enterocolitica]|nr:hypothetical protein [Yersinia massiliensis]QKJ09276.1 hypothetical protein HRD68_00180 [Yersinia massiliensis]HDX9051766.1 hypothetical protein [Yersinia enterocolitica]
MKLIGIFLMLCALTGCAQKNPLPSEISGSLEPINSAQVMNDVENKTDH